MPTKKCSVVARRKQLCSSNWQPVMDKSWFMEIFYNSFIDEHCIKRCRNAMFRNLGFDKFRTFWTEFRVILIFFLSNQNFYNSSKKESHHFRSCTMVVWLLVSVGVFFIFLLTFNKNFPHKQVLRIAKRKVFSFGKFLHNQHASITVIHL